MPKLVFRVLVEPSKQISEELSILSQDSCTTCEATRPGHFCCTLYESIKLASIVDIGVTYFSAMLFSLVGSLVMSNAYGHYR